MIGIELFSGSGILSRTLNEYGIKCYSFDIRKRKGICEPDFRCDISTLSSSDILHMIGKSDIHFIWCGLPCDIWSHASGGFHLNSNYEPKTKKAEEHLLLTKKCLRLISELRPAYFFIENPRGKLRFYKPMINWLVKNEGMIKELTLSSYGFRFPKPTNIYTNAYDLKFKELDSFGRGAKVPDTLNNYTTNQRQTYPGLFCKKIANYLLEKKKTRTFFTKDLAIFNNDSDSF